MRRWTVMLVTLTAILVMVGCSDDETVTQVDPATYVGSATCATTDCHEVIHQTWTESGHPYKLTKIDGVAPTELFPEFSNYPNDPVEPPATGRYSWDEISYTIGGYGWKMRWIDSDGYIITSGAAENDVQYNFENDTWTTYHTQDEPHTKPYNCGKCHTTGWVADEDWETDGTLEDNQDGLPGMHGTFVAGGVHCEECHGAGSKHVEDPDANGLLVDTNSTLCGRCHTRDAENHIAASGGYIKHHEQYDEWLHSPHSAVMGPGCIECHDPHASVKFDGVALGEGTKAAASCESCHTEITVNAHTGPATCVDCHMPKASKSAIAVHAYQGDIKTHIWSINTDAVGKDAMFDGSFVAEEGDGQAQVTLDFACYGCHQDESGVGGNAPMMTLEQLSAMAQGIHSPVPDLAFVGSETCGGCHADHHNRWTDSGHPYKLTKIEGAAPVDLFPDFSGWPNDMVDPPATGRYGWDEVTYTIGGYGWKMRWVDADGYVITSGAAANPVQYNFENDTWVTYHTQDEPGTKPYNCGGCHTTGWVADEDWETDGTLEDNQDGLEGMHGTFFAGGVHCEECHGMGSQHAHSPGVYDMTVDNSSALCGQCHTRNAENHIATSGGYIKHHEQYDEWLHSPHSSVIGPGCNDCHDPHSSVKYDGDAAGIGTTTACTDCHGDMYVDHSDFASCTDCHMPKASKSAIAVTLYQGDIKTHIWSINTAPVGKDAMMVDNLVVEDVDGQSMVTLDFACYSCHKDADGVGGPFSFQDLDALSARAIGIHTRAVSQK